MKKAGMFLLVVALIIAITSLATITAATSVKVQFYNGNTSATTNTIYLNIRLVNTGTDPITLSNVKMRYYFTNDGTQTNNFSCDWASAGNTNYTGTFVNITPVTGADRYIEIGFTSGAGTLAAGASTDAAIRVWKSDWSNFTQTNDYSFNSSASSHVDWQAIPVYINGSLYWGSAPGGSVTPTPIISATPTPTTRNTPTPTVRTTPTPTTPRGGQVYQAENAVYGSGAVFESSNGGYNGTGYINFPSSGGYLEFRNVDGGSGGVVTLRLRNALGVSGSRTGRMQVNGGTWQNITFEPTGAWTTWTIKNVTVTLNSGASNTIRLESTGQDLANIDELSLTAGGSTPTPTQRQATPTQTRRANTPTPTQGQIGTSGVVGWAAVNALGQNGTTGGAGGPTIHVYTKAELEAAANKDDNPAIIVVHGNLTGGPAMNTNVKSNKTIIGDGSGASLNFGLYLRGNNIIIKNLDIMNGGYNPGDSEGLDSISFAQDLHHIWVDHCTMHETMDGTVDPTRNARFVTISYCKFHTQNTTVLIGGSDSDDAAKNAQSSSDKRDWHYTVTVHHNYWAGVNSRCPRVRFGPVHIYNNYYENLGGYAIGRGDRSNIYSENNYFYNANEAFAAYDDSSNPGYVNDVGSLFEGDNGNTTDNPPSGNYAWTPGQYYSYTAHSAAWVKANLKNYCGVGKGNP